MLDERDIERIKKMTPGDRLRLAFGLLDMAWRFLLPLPPEERQRRLDLTKNQPWRPPPGPMEE